MKSARHPVLRHAARLLALVLLCALALQLAFLLRIALMLVVDPQSTTFQRSEAWRLVVEKHQLLWSQDAVDGNRLSNHLRRAVIASEDAGFADHGGVEWDAIEKAWERNQQVQARAARPGAKAPASRLRGGSTITQQLAKNLLLSSERRTAAAAGAFTRSVSARGRSRSRSRGRRSRDNHSNRQNGAAFY